MDASELMAAIMEITRKLLSAELTRGIRNKGEQAGSGHMCQQTPLLFQLGLLFSVTESFPGRYTLKSRSHTHFGLGKPTALAATHLHSLDTIIQIVYGEIHSSAKYTPFF